MGILLCGFLGCASPLFLTRREEVLPSRCSDPKGRGPALPGLSPCLGEWLGPGQGQFWKRHQGIMGYLLSHPSAPRPRQLSPKAASGLLVYLQ